MSGSQRAPVSSPLSLTPPVSQQRVLEQLVQCDESDLLGHLQPLKVQTWERCVATSWHLVLTRFDAILGAFLRAGDGLGSASPSEELVCEVLRVLHDVVLLHQELKGPVEKLRDLLQCSQLKVLLGALRCLAACPPSRHLQGQAASLERRLEVLACGGVPSILETGSFRDACSSQDYMLEDFRYEYTVPGESQTSVWKVPLDKAPDGSEAFDVLKGQFEAKVREPAPTHPDAMLQLRLWCRARTLDGRREVVAIALLAICNAVKHIRASVLQQYLQKRPGLLSELCEMLQSLQSVGTDAGIAALRVTAAFLDSRFGQSRSEASQLSQMLGLSLPHGIVACALRGLLGHRPTNDRLEDHNAVLSAALDLFQITTVNNHQSTVQLGHAGMILAMLELMQKTDVPSLAAVAAMLRCLELAAEVSSTAALVLFRDFNGLQAFSLRLQREVELLMVLDFTGDALEMEPPPASAPLEERQRFRALLEEVTARRRLCRQLLKNIQTALQCSEVLQAGLANIFQGPMMDALKVAVKAPVRVGLSLFGTAIDIVSSVIQDDPSRVPQLIETNVLPEMMGALSKETMRSTECLSFVPGILASIALHAVGEDFILGLASKPIQLLIDVLVDPTFVPLLCSQPELIQIMSTQMDKVLRNRPNGVCKLTEHVAESVMGSFRVILEQAKVYPDWTPLDLEDHTQYLPDRLAPFSRFCWSLLSTNEHVLKCFIEKQGLSLVRDVQELPCLPYFFASLEGQQHPIASLFNLQAKYEEGNVPVAAELKEMLSTSIEKVMPTLKECAAGDPYAVIASMEDAKVLAFLRSLSRMCTVLEDLLSIGREGSSVQVMEAVRQPLEELAPFAALIFVVAAWQPHERERMPPTACYHETTKQVFSPSPKEGAGQSDAAPDGTGAVVPAASESPFVRAARVGFRLTCRTLRQLMQLSSKLQTRVRREGTSMPPLTMARSLAQVAKAVLVAPVPPSSPVALRWVAEVFDMLQKMHEEQNKVALRSFTLCAFYQAGCFDLLQPLIQMTMEKIGDSDEQGAGAALSAALGYFEKVTSTRRFANAYLRDDAVMSKEMLCKSIQAESLRCLLPVWRHANFVNFPRSSCCSLLKVWLHLLQEPKSEPRTVPPRNVPPDWQRLSSVPPLPGFAAQQDMETGFSRMADVAAAHAARAAAAATTAANVAAATAAAVTAAANVAAPAAPEAAGTAAAAAAEVVTTTAGAVADAASTTAGAATPGTLRTGDGSDNMGTLVDMGFSRTQVDAALRHFGSGGTEDINQLIVWMVANPTVEGEGEGVPTLRPAVSQEEFQSLLCGLLEDLLPRLLACGRQVPKALNAVVDTMCHVAENSSPLWERAGDADSNSKAVVRACVEELGDTAVLPTSDTLICVTQILANLFHRRPATSKALGDQGVAELLGKLHRWCTMCIDFSKSAAERGYRMLHFSTSAPVPSGVGEPLLAPPAWLTPTIVCAHQLLCQADLVKMREGREALDKETQQTWVTLILDLVYAFPGLDGQLAQPCLQVLLRLCSVSAGARAFLTYQQHPQFNRGTQGTVSVDVGGVKALHLLFRLGKQAAFQGLLQMLSDLVVLLLEEAPVLQQRMEAEILGLLGARKEVPARDIYQPLFPLMSRNPQLFEDALKVVAQRTRSASPDALMLAPIPEAERPLRPKKGSTIPASALIVLQTLVHEICFGIDVQFRTSWSKLHEVAAKTSEQEEEESASTLPPAYPLALGPNCILCVLDGLLLRLPGISMHFLKSPLPVGAPSAEVDRNYFVVDSTPAPSYKSLLLLMMRHLLPQIARLSEQWPKQISLLKSSQRLAMSGAINPVQRLLPHLGAVLCAAARQPGEPRKTLVLEAIVMLRSLADSPRVVEDQGVYGSQVSSLSTIVARLLSAASAAERKEEKETPANPNQEKSPRLAALDTPGGSNAAAPPAKKARTRKEAPFSAKEELQVLRDAFVAVLARLDLQRSESSQVAGAVVRCLELLSRREIQTGADTRRADTSPRGPEMMRTESLDSDGGPRRLYRIVGPPGASEVVREVLQRVRQGEDFGVGEEEAVEMPAVEDDEEEEDDDEEMGEGGDEAMEEDEDEDEEGGEMDHMDGDGEEEEHEHHGHDDGEEADEDEEEGEYDEGEEEYENEMDGDFGPDGQGIASVLQNAIQVFDQEHPRMDGESMTFRVDIDLGEAGVIHGVHRGGQFRRMQMPPPPGLRVASANIGWVDPGEMEGPHEHPLLRRDQSNMEPHPPQLAQWMPPGSIRQFLGNVEPIIRTPSSLSVPSAANNAGHRNEDFEAVFSEVARRLQANFAVPEPVVVPSNSAGEDEKAAVPPPEASLHPVPPPPQDEEMRPAADDPPEELIPAPAPVAPAPVPVIPPTPGAPPAEDAAEAQNGPSNAEIWALAQAFASVQGLAAPEGSVGGAATAEPAFPAVSPETEPVPATDAQAAEASGELPADEPVAGEPPAPPEPAPEEPVEEEDSAACLGISELQRMASRLGCSQSAILQAAGIDVSVVAALPEDMRAPVVMAEVSQVNLDHLRRAPQAAETDAAASQAGPAPSEIDAVVLEALPADIRDEVLRDEAARRREQQQAALAAAEAPRPTPSSELDNASFIASLDPLLREEVLLSAPEEVLRTLPAELVAEAQLLRDRAFTRIAMRREVPPVSGRPAIGISAPPGMSQASSHSQRGVQTQAWPRQHAHLLMIEQQLLHHSSGVRRWGGPIGLQRPPRGQGESGAPGLSSFDDSDQQLLQRLADFDDGTALEVPLPTSVIPHTCRLLYLRQEIATMPMTRLCFNLSLHPVTRSWLLGHFLVLLCRQTEMEAPLEALPPPCLFEGLEGPKLPHRSSLEVQSVGSQRVLAILAYLLRRVPQCGDFFARKLQSEPWLKTFQAPQWLADRSKKSRGDLPLLQGLSISELPGHCAVNLLMQLVNTRLYLSSSRHAAWLLSVLHALLVPQPALKSSEISKDEGGEPFPTPPAFAPAPGFGPPPSAQSIHAPAESASEAQAPGAGPSQGQSPGEETPGSQRWTKIIEDMHMALSQKSVLALCHFLCHAGSGHGSSSEGDAFQLAGDILVALAASCTHLDTVRCELMQVLATLVTDIERALQECEAAAAEPSTIESRFLRVVRTLTEVFREASKTGPDDRGGRKPERFMEEARVEMLWDALDRTLERLDDPEMAATPAQRLLSSGPEADASSPDNSQSPPKPLLNRLLPLIEAFFVLHGHITEETDKAASPAPAKPEEPLQMTEGGSSSSQPGKVPSRHVFAELHEQSAAERSRFGQFCKKHRRPLNALLKQTPSLLSKSFAPVLQFMPSCLDFDNKRAYFRAQLRSRRLESRYQTIRLRVRRNEIFMDSYHQLRIRTGEEMRAKIQVQFQGEEGIDAGGVAKEWYGALAREIFNPNYALFVQAGGKACTYHPNPMSYVNRDHLQFFHFIGRVVGKAIHDGQNLEAWFTRGFYKHMLGKKVIPADLEAFDPEYFSNLKWMLDHDITDIIELTFSAESDELGQIKVVDLKPQGRTMSVTNDNKHEYIQLMSEHKMTNSVKQQIEFFLKGLHEIVPPQLLSLFDDKELELLISGLPDIDIEDLKQNTEYHNYTPLSDQVQWFWKVLSEFTQEQRAWFLQFATGTSRVPVEGFKGLVGMRGPQKFSLHRAYGSDRLPSAHTCFNQVDLPEYPSEDVLRDKLLQAVSEGHEGFGFA